MGTKLGLYLFGDPSRYLDNVLGWRPTVVILFDYESPEVVRALFAAGARMVVYRKYVDYSYETPPDAFVFGLPSKLMGLGLVWEGLNEPQIADADQARRLSDWYVRFAELMHARGEQVAAYSFSTGNPRSELIPYLQDGLNACDLLALHEYYAQNAGEAMWGRWREFYNQIPTSRRTIVTECGFDNGGGIEDGWQSNISMAEYMSILERYDEKMLSDDRVIGGTIFQLGGGGMWRSFNLDNLMNSLTAYAVARGGGVPIVPELPPPPPDKMYAWNEPFRGGLVITQFFGENPDFYKDFELKGHEGIDAVPFQSGATTVLAVEAGDVVRDVDDPQSGRYGIYVTVLNRETRRAWWYCHLSENRVSLGEHIERGQALGTMGATGLTFGAHLHLGLRLADENGNAINLDNGYKGFVDPLPVLKQIMPVPPPPPPPPPETLEEALAAEALKLEWMPINTDAALYRYAQAHGLGYPQTDEFQFQFQGRTYIAQVYHGGIVYVLSGDWGNVKSIPKPNP